MELSKGSKWCLPEALAPHVLASPVAALVFNVTKISDFPHVSFYSVHPPLPESETVSENTGIPQKWKQVMNYWRQVLISTEWIIYVEAKSRYFSSFFSNLTHCSLRVKLYLYNLHYNQLNIIFTNQNANSHFLILQISSMESTVAEVIIFPGWPEMGFKHP